jgi:RNA polymerase-binding transcription factor DksA
VKSAAKARPRPAGSAAKRHARSVKPVRKTPAPKKKAVIVKKMAPVTRKATPVAKKQAVTVLKKQAAPVTRKPVPAAKQAIPVTKKGAAKGAVPAAKLPPRRMKAVPRPPTPGPVVRPLGVLPPEARARGIERPAHVPAVLSQPATGPARSPKPAPKAPGLQRVTEKDLKELEVLLLAERVRVMKEMGHLESTVLKVNPRESAGDLSGYSFHMADAGTDAYEREKAFQFASNEGRLLLDLDEALRRLYRGEYGNCESCGNAIAKARLEAMPTARLCRDCKELEERENRPQQ